VPRLTGKMDYSPYTMADESLVAMVLPALLDFLNSEPVAAQLAVMHDNGKIVAGAGVVATGHARPQLQLFGLIRASCPHQHIVVPTSNHARSLD
jgi:hypothetical protein